MGFLIPGSLVRVQPGALELDLPPSHETTSGENIWSL